MEETCKNSNRPKNFNELMRSAYFWRPALGLIIGGIAGFLYYHFEGCTSGSCGIAGNPVSSIITGSLMGLFFVNSPCRSC